MFKNFEIKRNNFFAIVIFLFLVLVFTFVFSHRSFFNFEKKHSIIKSKKETITSLKIEIIQLKENIDRLKNDREYVVSYAKTFGYLDKSKNEKIVRIIENSKDDMLPLSSINNQKENKLKTEFSVITALVLASLVITVVGIYLVYSLRKKKVVL